MINRFQYQTDDGKGGSKPKAETWDDAMNQNPYSHTKSNTTTATAPTKKEAAPANTWDEAMNQDPYATVKKKDGGTDTSDSLDTTKSPAPSPSQLPIKPPDKAAIKNFYSQTLSMGKEPTLDVLKKHGLADANAIANARNNIKNQQVSVNDLTVFSGTPDGVQMGLDQLSDDGKKAVSYAINNQGQKIKAAGAVLNYVKKYSPKGVDTNKVFNVDNLGNLSEFRDKATAALKSKIQSMTPQIVGGDMTEPTNVDYSNKEQIKQIDKYRAEIDDINDSFNKYIGFKLADKYKTSAGGEHNIRKVDYTALGKEYIRLTGVENSDIVAKSKRTDAEAQVAKQNVIFNGYEMGLVLSLADIQSNYNDNLAQAVLNKDQLKLQHADTYGGQIDDLSHAYNNRFEKFPSVAFNNVSKVINDEIAKEKGYFNVFTSKQDVNDAVERLNKSNPEFVNTFGKYIDYYRSHPEDLGGRGILTDFLKSAEGDYNDLANIFKSKEDIAISQAADQTNPRHQYTSFSGESPTKTILTNNGTSFIEKENESYIKWYDPNNLTRIVGSGLPGIIEFATLEEASGGLGTGLFTRSVSVLNKVGKDVSMVTGSLIGADDITAGYKAIKFSEDALKGIKTATGLVGAQYATSFNGNMQFTEDNMKDATHPEKIAAAHLITLFQAATFKLAGISPSSMLGVSIRNSAVKEAAEFLAEHADGYAEKDLSNFFQSRLVPLVQSAGVSGLKLGGISVVSQAAKDAVGKVFNPKYQSAADYGKIFTESAILGAATEGFGKIVAGVPNVHTDALYNAGLYKDELTQIVNESVGAGRIDQDKANKMIQAINTMHSKIIFASLEKNKEGLPLSTSQIKQISLLNFRRSYLTEENRKLAEAGNKSGGEDHKTKIDDNNNIIKGIDKDIQAIQGQNAWHKVDGSNFVKNMDIRTGYGLYKEDELKNINPTKKYYYLNDKGERVGGIGRYILNYINKNFKSDEEVPLKNDFYLPIVDLDGKTIRYEKIGVSESEDAEDKEAEGGDAESEDAESKKAEVLKAQEDADRIASSFKGLRDDDFASQYFSKEEYARWTELEKDKPDEAKKLIADKKQSLIDESQKTKVIEPKGNEIIKEGDMGSLPKVNSDGGKYEIGINAPIKNKKGDVLSQSSKYQVSVATLGDVDNGNGIEKGYINREHLSQEFDTREEANNYINKFLSKDKTAQQNKSTQSIPIEDIKGGKEQNHSISKVYKENTDLQKSGTQEEYQTYIDNVFPDSKVKDVVFHGGKKGIETFAKKGDVEYKKNDFATDNGIYFAHDEKDAKTYAKKFIFNNKNKQVYAVVLDVKNPYDNVKQVDKRDRTRREIDMYSISDADMKWLKDNGYDAVTNKGRVKDLAFTVVFDPKQVHILGSKSDIEGFNKSKTDIQGEQKQNITDNKQTPTVNEQKETGQKKQDHPIKETVASSAREYAKALRSGEKKLPSWLSANLPEGTKISGAVTLTESLATALDIFASVHEATSNVAKAIEAGFNHLKRWLDDNEIKYDEDDLKNNFRNELNIPKKKSENEDVTLQNKISKNAESIENGTAHIDRLSQEEERGRKEGGRTNVEASLILGADKEANSAAYESYSKRELADRQEELLAKHADENGLWKDESEVAKEASAQLPSGKESNAYLSKDGTTVTKFIDYSAFDSTPEAFIDNRISLYNHIFDSTPYNLVGFSKDPQTGKLKFVVEQPFIHGRSIDFNNKSDAELVTNELEQRGFKETSPTVFSNKDYVIHDVKNGNVIADDKGNLHFIDVVPTLNTSEKLGGERKYGDGKIISHQQPETAIGFAPYRAKNVNTLSEDKDIRDSPEYKLHQKNVEKMAEGLGLKIKSRIDSRGGYVDSETGKPVQEVSNVIHVIGDPEKVKVLAAALGKAAPEQQDSVIIGNYDENGGGLEHVISTGSFENAEKALEYLKQNNLQYFTIDTKTGDIIILDTDTSNNQNIDNFVEQLKENGINAGHEIAKVNADFIEHGSYDKILAGQGGEAGSEKGFDINAYIEEAKGIYADPEKVKAALASGKGEEPPPDKPVSIEDDPNFTSWEAIRKSRQIEIDKVKQAYENQPVKHWTESLANGLAKLQRDYPNDNLYDAAKKQMSATLYKMHDTGKAYVDDEDLAVLQYFKRETSERMAKLKDDIASPDESRRKVANLVYTSLKSDYDDAALAIKYGGTSLSRGLGYLRSEMGYDADNGLVLRRMDMEAAKGSALNADELKESAAIWHKERENHDKIAAAREKAMRDDFEAEMKRINKEWEEKFKDVKKSKNYPKNASQSIRNFADKIRNSDTLDKLGLGGSVIEGADIQGVSFNVKEALAKTLEYIADGVDKAEAIAKAIKEVGGKVSKEFEDLTNKAILRVTSPDREAAFDAIKEMSKENNGEAITKKMSQSTAIRDYVNSHIGDVDQKDIFDTAYEGLKKIIPKLDKDQLLEAYLRRGDYSMPTSLSLNSSRKTAEQQLASIAKLEQDIKDLKDLKHIREREGVSDREKSGYEEELIAKKGKQSKLAKIEVEKKMFEEQGESLRKAIKLTRGQLDAELQAKENELRRIMTEKGVKYAHEDEFTKASLEQRAASHNERMSHIQKRIEEKLAAKELTEEERAKLMSIKEQLGNSQVTVNRQSRLSQKDAVERGLKSLEDIHDKYNKSDDVRTMMGKSIETFEEERKDAEQQIKLARTKIKFKNDIIEIKRKLAAGEYEDKPIVHLTRTDAELIQLDRDRRAIIQFYNKKKTEYEKAHYNNTKRIVEFSRAAIVTSLIWKFGTFSKVVVSGALRPQFEAASKLTGGKLFEALPFDTTKEIVKRAKAGGESSSWRAIAKGYEAMFRQYNADDIDKLGSKANDAFEKADSEYQKQKSVVDGMNKSDAGYKAEDKKLTDLKSKKDEALIGAVANMIYEYIGGSSIREALDVFLHRTAGIDKVFGEFDTENYNMNEKFYSLDNLDYALGFFGRSHAAAKNFSSRASFAAGFVARLEYAVKEEGIDITQPENIMKLANEAYLDWDRGKYQERNWLVDSWNIATNEMSKVFPQLAYLMAADVAITRVPANMIYEGIAEYTLGAITGSFMAWREYVKARNAVLNFDVSDKDTQEFKDALTQRLKEIPPERAAKIYRAFRKGGFGLGFFALAAIGGVSFGGFGHKGQTADDKKKKKIDDETGSDLIKTGEIRIGDFKIPDWAAVIIEHTPGFQSVFYGKGAYDLYHNNVLMGDMYAEAATEAIMAHVDHITNSIPIIDKVMLPLGKDIFATTTDALGVSKFGQWTDIDQSGNPVVRKPLKAADYMKYITGRKNEELSDRYYKMAVSTEREYKNLIALTMNNLTLSKEEKEQQRKEYLKDKEDAIDNIYDMNKNYPQ